MAVPCQILQHFRPTEGRYLPRTCLNAALARAAIWESSCSVSFSKVGMASLAAGPGRWPLEGSDGDIEVDGQGTIPPHLMITSAV